MGGGVDTTSLAPHFLQSLRGATQSGKTGHLNRVVRLFSFLFFLNGVGFCTRLNFGGKSFEPLKISLWATLIEADWDGFLLSPPACPLPSTLQQPCGGRQRLGAGLSGGIQDSAARVAGRWVRDVVLTITFWVWGCGLNFLPWKVRLKDPWGIFSLG